MAEIGGGEVKGQRDGIIEVGPRLFQFPGQEWTPHSYLICGESKIAIIDPGSEGHYRRLEARLSALGLAAEDVDLVLNTHEHLGHAGAGRFFQEHALVAAHRLAATRIILDARARNGSRRPLRVHLWLENNAQIDLGGYVLKVLHTPGHTSGSICLYEPRMNFLFTGDTVFAGGMVSVVRESGSASDYVNTLTRLANFQLRAVYPGHGVASHTPVDDLSAAIEQTLRVLVGEIADAALRSLGRTPATGNGSVPLTREEKDHEL